MPTLEDVRRLALSLPETSEATRWHRATWFVKKKHFVWERPLSKKDVRDLGWEPEGPVIAASTEDLVAKEALLQDGAGCYFTTPHFDGYPAILVKLDEISEDDLRELVVEAWLVQAPKRLAKEYLEAAGA